MVHEPRSQARACDRGSRRTGSRDRAGERGASAVEYGLLLAGVAALIAAAVFAFGGGASGLFDGSCSKILEDSHIAGSCP